MRPCSSLCIFVVRNGNRSQFPSNIGMPTSNTITHLFRVAFQDLIGILYFFDASWIAKQTSFNTDSTFMYCLQFLVNLRITLFTDSVALVV
jgi:hypothetical protein